VSSVIKVAVSVVFVKKQVLKECAMSSGFLIHYHLSFLKESLPFTKFASFLFHNFSDFFHFIA
jgi:hypothetical protein